MNKLYLFVLLLLFTSCTKEEDETNEYANGNDKVGIVGKWKLVEYVTVDSWGNYVTQDKTSENYVISFDSLGNSTDSRISCEGKYFVVEDASEPENKRNILSISFDCNKTNTEIDLRDYKYSMGFADNNRLVLNAIPCIEVCVYEFKRLKD